MLTDYEHRFALTNELHARPSVPVKTGTRVFHMGLLTGEGDRAQDRAAMEALCERFGVAPPPPEANHFVAQFPTFRMKWELHTEFTAYTVFAELPEAADFDAPARSLLPDDWLETLPGEVIVSLQMIVLACETAAEMEKLPQAFQSDFAPDSLCASVTGDGRASVWTDFRLHADGMSRMLILANRREMRGLGRLVQRLLEIESYRTLAMLGLPAARTMMREISRMRPSLLSLMEQLSKPMAISGERALLDDLTKLSSELEILGFSHAYRLSATVAYHAIVRERIAALREKRVQGLRTFRGFLDQRLEPSMRTCVSASEREARVSERLTRAANLLRTRVDVGMEEQNKDLLVSMERRARLQLRLQETVEGLSVIAISYYALGIIGYALKAVESVLPVSVEVAVGVCAPIVLVGVYLLTKRVRKRLMQTEKPANAPHRAAAQKQRTG